MTKYYRIIRYLFGGGLATLINIGLLFICVHFFNLWYLTAAIIGFCTSVIASYIIQKFWTFRHHETEGMHAQFFIFSFFAVVMLGLNTLLMYVAVNIFGLWYLLAQIIISAIIAFINYAFFSKVVFI